VETVGGSGCVVAADGDGVDGAVSVGDAVGGGSGDALGGSGDAVGGAGGSDRVGCGASFAGLLHGAAASGGIDRVGSGAAVDSGDTDGVDGMDPTGTGGRVGGYGAWVQLAAGTGAGPPEPAPPVAPPPPSSDSGVTIAAGSLEALHLPLE